MRDARGRVRGWGKGGVGERGGWEGDGCARRRPGMDGAARVVRKLGGASMEGWVTYEVPRRILAGEPVLG